MKIICVLKTGGDYGPEYVKTLAKGIAGNLTNLEYEFVVYTDDVLPSDTFPDNQCWEIFPLEKDLPGWWAKLEAFRLKGPAIYLDLDTYVAGNLNLGIRSLATELLMHEQKSAFYMLRPFSKSEAWASGVMAWAGDWSWLLKEITNEAMTKYEWDQRYISAKMFEKNISIISIQRHITNIVSYKHHCREGIPEGAELVCFHGHPRPHEVGGVYYNAI